jgi:hypothetical protein
MNRRGLFSALFLVLILGLFSLAGCGNRPGEMKGKVTATSSGQTVAQAHVKVYGLTSSPGDAQGNVFVKGSTLQEAITDANGGYSVSLAPGSYIVEVWAGEQKVASRMITVKAGQTVTADFAVDLPSP